MDVQANPTQAAIPAALTLRQVLDSESTQQRSFAKKVSLKIDKYLRTEAKKFSPKEHIFLLILGPADSGKSTVLKQMTLIHGAPVHIANKATQEELAIHRLAIHHNICKNFLILEAVVREMNSSLISTENELMLDRLAETRDTLAAVLADGTIFIPAALSQTIELLWETEAVKAQIQAAYRNGFEDSATYFLEGIDVILSDGYIPSNDDMLNFRKVTENVSDTVFFIEDKFWHIIDVAGQRDKRARWAGYFEKDIQGIIFVLSSVGYMQQTQDEPAINTMVDAFELFSHLVNHPILRSPSFVIFINKCDLLNSRLVSYAVSDYLPDYKGAPGNKKEFVQYVIDQFVAILKTSKSKSYFHQTTATSITAMENVVRSVE